MDKIATHDSATGEDGKGILSWLVTPFARTQSKTIKEQYYAGCRMFDIRIVKRSGVWRCAHGLWITERTATDILSEINDFPESCFVTITYEGKGDNICDFKEYVKWLQDNYVNIYFGPIAIKYGKGSSLFKVKYDYLEPSPIWWPPAKQGFLSLDGKTWHIIFPVPLLWKNIYYDTPEFNDKYYVYVDFL